MKTFLALVFICSGALADEARLKAYTIHNRIAGVPPTAATLAQMESAIKSNGGVIGLEAAARIAMESDHFYNLKLKNWIKPWTNQEKSKRVDLNDMAATIIGAIRDSDTKPFSRILYDDVIYVGPSFGDEDDNFSRRNNNHYREIESRGISLKNSLVERMQSQNINTENNIQDNNKRDTTNMIVNGVNGAAGVFTTRAHGEAFYMDGTNRRATRYAFMNFMCKDFEDLHDTKVPDFRVRRDVERSPGGDARTYKNTCVGCHAGQDALGGAFAYYDWIGNNRIRFTPGNVAGKMNRNPDFLQGHVTTDDSWMNLWASGQNASLGWRGSVAGNGIKEFGQMLARSRQFSVCMSQKVFKLVCVRPPLEEDSEFINKMADEFEANNSYNMKSLFAKTVAKCVEEDV